MPWHACQSVRGTIDGKTTSLTDKSLPLLHWFWQKTVMMRSCFPPILKPCSWADESGLSRGGVWLGHCELLEPLICHWTLKTNRQSTNCFLASWLILFQVFPGLQPSWRRRLMCFTSGSFDWFFCSRQHCKPKRCHGSCWWDTAVAMS